MTSRLNNPNQALTQKNVNTHIFTEFSEMNKETTQQQVLDAIKNININVGEIVLGDITVESSDTVTHDKLTTLNTTVTNKHLNSSTDSISVSGTVAISNDIIIVDNINNTDAPYDLIINGPTLWADSRPLVNPFFADPNGREGWYYDNFNNIANVSNIYWYANPVSGNLQENDMTFAQLSGMYCIITPDYVENGELTVPFMGVYSQPTGTNDFIPTFAHSRWVYQLNATNRSKLRKAETVLLYTGTTRPEVHLNIPAYQLTLFSTNGTALSSEIIAYMTVNTQATTSKIGYLLQYTGFLNSAIGFNREFQFKNGKERVIENNQYSGSINVGNFPTTQAISGNVGITGTPSVTVGNFPTTQAISGNVGITGTPSVSVGNFPTTQDVSGSVSVSNFPTTQAISGNVGITGTPSVSVGNFPTTQAISGNVGITGTPSVNATITGTPSVNATITGTPSVTVGNFPTTQAISGNVGITGTPSVTVGNFPTTQAISGNVGITGTPSVTVGNFPTTQAISGNVGITGTPSVSVGNFPITQDVSGSVSVSNFPTTQAISGNVGITGTPSVSVGNFPTTQAISGNVGITGTPSVTVGNFPTTQAISGNVGITGTPSVSVGNFPTTQAISGNVGITGTPSVSVGNFPITQDVSGSVSVSNFPTTQAISGNVGITGTPSVSVGNFPTTQAISGNVGITGTPSVSVGNFPTTQDVSGSVSVSNFPTTQAISGNVGITGTPSVTVGNFPTTQAISGNVGITGTPSVSVGNFPTTQAISGNVGITGTPSVTTTLSNATSSIQIYGIYGTNNTKTAIKTDVDGKLEVVGEFSSVIDAATSSILMVGDDYSGAVPAVQNPLFVDANGFITTDFIQIEHQDINFGFDTMASNMTTGNAGATWSKTNPISTTDDGWYLQGNGFSSLLWYNNGDYLAKVFPIQSNFTFADIDIWFMILKNYFPFNTTTQIMPQIYIYSKPTGSGDFIGGLCHSVWYYTCNANQSINYGESIMIYTGQLARVKKINPELRRIPYTNTGGGGDRANTEIINHIEFTFNTGFTYKILVQEGGVYVKNQGLLNYYFTTDNTTNADIATIAMNTTTSAINTKLTGMTYTSNRLQTQATLVDAGGDVATISTPTTTTTPSTIRGLDTQSYLNAYNFLTDLYGNLTSTLNSPATPSSSYNALDVYARNPSTQVINYGQTTVNGLSGLNIYQVYPKKIHYTLSGRSESVAQAVIMGGTGSQKFIYDFTFGKATPQTFSAILAATSGTPRTLKYHYVDSLGVLRTDGSISVNNSTNTNLTPSTIISINKFWIDGAVGLNEQVLIRVGAANTAINTIASADNNDYYNGVVTIPNGYIGYLSQFSMYSPTAIWFQVQKWDENSIRSVVYTHHNAANQGIASGANGSIGMILTAGESVCFSKDASGSSTITGNIVLEPI